MTMSILDKRSVCLRVTRHHRRLSSSCESVMDEADREVSTLTDRAFRSLCIGDEAVYSDAEFAGLSPSPGSCLLKPLADEHSRKVLENAPSLGTKKLSSNGATTAAWQQKDVSSLLSAFTSGKNGNGAKMANGMLSESGTESWDKSALLSIQRELAEFSTDFHSGFTDNRKHLGSSEKKSSKKSGKDTSGAPVGKSNSKSKHSKSSSKLRKLNSRNFFLHSEFSPFQAWKDLQHFPFGQEHAHISDLLPSDSFPRWGDSAFYRHLTAAHTLNPQAQTQELIPAHRSGPASAPECQRQGTEKHTPPQKSETAQRFQHSHKHTTAQADETAQKTPNILQSKQTNGNVKKIESVQRADPEQNRVKSPQVSDRVERTVRGDRELRTEEARTTERLESVESLRQPLGDSTELLARPGDADTPSVAQTPSALEPRRLSDSTEPIAPWRRNRVRARSAAPAGHLEKSSPAADSRPPTSTELARKQEVRRMEAQSSDSVTPFNITHLLTPIIPCRQDTESLDPVALPALFSPTTLDVPAASTSERKPSPDTRAREGYRCIAASLLFNLKDNRKRVKARYSPPKFRPTDPCDPTRLDWVALGKDLTDADAGTLATPVMGDATAMSPVLESTSTLALPGNQRAESRPDQLSVPGGVSQGIDLSHGTENRSPVLNKAGYPSLNLYRRTSAEAEVAMETQEDMAVGIGQSSRPIRKEKEPPKKSVKERVKELQGQSTDSSETVNRNSATRSKERPPVGPPPGLKDASGEHGQAAKNRPPEVPAKPAVLPKPAKQPPPVPARVKYPLKNDPDSSAADAEAGLVTAGEAAFSIEAKHSFSARQNNYIKSQRSAALLDEEEKNEDWGEVREVALLKHMQAETQAHLELQRRQHREPHTQSAQNELLLPLHGITLQSNKSSRAKNTSPVNSEDQDRLKPQDSASPAPERRGRKGVLTLKGNTLAKRHLFSHLEQAHSQPSSRHSRNENDTVDKYDLAMMALEEVIAEREEKKRKGQGSSAELPEQRQTESRTGLSKQREGELGKVRKNGEVDISEDISVLKSCGNQSIHSERQAANTNGHSSPIKLAQDGSQQEPASNQQMDLNKEGQRRRGGGASTDKTNPDRTGQGRGRGAVQPDQASQRVKEQGSLERERGDRTERNGESGPQRVRTPPAVPPRKGRPGVKDEERTDPEGLRGRAERPTEGETTGTRAQGGDHIHTGIRAQESDHIQTGTRAQESDHIHTGTRAQESDHIQTGTRAQGGDHIHTGTRAQGGDHIHVGRKTEKSAKTAKDNSVPRETQNNKQAQLTTASRDNIQSPASRDNIQSPASRDNIQSPASGDNKQSPASRDNIQSPASRDNIQSPASRDNIQSPASRHNIQSPASRDNKQSPASRDSIQSPASRYKIQSPASRYNIQSPASRDNTQLPANRDSIQSPASRNNIQSPASKDSIQSPASRDNTQSPASRDNTQSPASRDNTQSPASRDSIQSPASRDSIQSPASRDNIQSPASRDNTQSPASRDSIQSPASRHNQTIDQECSTRRDTKAYTETYTQKSENKSSEKYKDNQHKTDTISATVESSSKQSVTDSQHKPDDSKSETVLRYTPKMKECPDPTKEQAPQRESAQKEGDSENEEGRQRDGDICGQREEVKERNGDQKEQKVKQGRSYVKDFLSLLGLASEEKANTDEDTEVERDISKPDPASPEPHRTEAPLEASVTIHDILKLRSPALSPLQSPVISPSQHGDGPSTDRAKENSGKAEQDYCLFSNPGSESDSSERLMSPLSDVDKGGWVRSLIEHAHNLSPKNLTPVSLTPSQSNASSPTPAKPVLFKVKDNTFATSPVTKTVRPILLKSVQDVIAEPRSRRKSLSSSDRGSERDSERAVDRGPDRGEVDRKGPPGIPILVEMASSPLLEDSSPVGGTALVATGAPATSPSQQPLGQMLAVPEEEAGRSSVSSGISSGLSECMRSTGDTCDEAHLSTAQTDDTEGSKAPSERSGSVCSGIEGSCQSRKAPPAVLPKTEKALRRAMKLTTRRIQKAEGKGGRTDRKHQGNSGEGTEHDLKNRREKAERSDDPAKKSSGREKAERSDDPAQKSSVREKAERSDDPAKKSSGREKSELKQKKREEHTERDQSQDRERAEQSEREHKNRDRERVEHPQLEQNHHGKTNKHARDKSEHISHHGDRKGRSGEKHARLKHVSHSTDRHIGNHRDLRSHGNGRVTSEHATEQQREHPQPYLRQSPAGGAGSHGDRRSRSLERDVPVQSEVLHQRLGKPHPGRCPRQPHDITAAAESSGGSSHRSSLNRFLTGQDSAEQTHGPLRMRQGSSEHTHFNSPGQTHTHHPSTGHMNSSDHTHTHHPSAGHLNSSDHTHTHHPSTGHLNSSDHTHTHHPSAGHLNSSDHTHTHHPSTGHLNSSDHTHTHHPPAGHLNSSDHTYTPSTRRQDTHHYSTVRRNSSEHQYSPSVMRQNSSEPKYPPAMRQNSSDFSYPPSIGRQNSSDLSFPPSSSNLMTQAYPMTQRKLLQDPDSGQYFVVDMPVQVTTKTFFDPETSSYVQLPVQSAEGALPSGPSLEVLNPSLVLYHGFVPVPVSSRPTAKSSSSSAPQARSGDTEDIEHSAQQWPEDPMHKKCSRNERPYIEPVYVPKDHTPEEELDSVR